MVVQVCVLSGILFLTSYLVTVFFSFCFFFIDSHVAYLAVSLCGGSVPQSLCCSLEENSCVVLGKDKDGWSESTGVGGGGGDMGSLDNNASKWAPHAGYDFCFHLCSLYFLHSFIFLLRVLCLSEFV